MDLDLTNDFLGVTEFRSVIRESLERVEQTRRPLILTKGGKPSAVLLDVDSYQALCDTLKQANHQALMESLRRAEADVAAGRTHSHEEAMKKFEERREQRRNGSKSKD